MASEPPTHFSALERRPVYRQVADELRAAILDGRMPPGSELPPERALSERFGVGRTTVREALRALEAQRLVESVGATAPLRVAGPSSEPVRDGLVHLLRLGAVPLGDLVDLRCALESAAVLAAAERRPRELLDRAQEELDVMRSAIENDDSGVFDQADVRFHLALVEASGNRALQLVMLAVRDSMSAHLLATLRAAPDPAAPMRQIAREHEAILAAIEAGDGPAADAALRTHIRGFYDRAAREGT